MPVVNYDDDRVGLLSDDGAGVIDLTDRFDISCADPVRELIARELDPTRYADEAPDHDLSTVDLGPPIRHPRKVVAINSNWPKRPDDTSWESNPEWERDFKKDGPFIKSSRSVIGPGDTIEVPFSDRRIDHELELGVVVGPDVKGVSEAEAFEHIFGFTIVNDVTMRGDEVRSYRKSFDTFTVIGPAIALTGEIDDPHDLAIELTKNGEVMQSQTTAEMVYQCDEILSFLSQGNTLGAGDVVATGTPLGCSRLAEGDTITMTIEGVGSMTNPVTVADAEFDELV